MYGKDVQELVLIYYYMGNILNKTGHYRLAIKKLEKALRKNKLKQIDVSSLLTGIHTDLGKANCEMGNFDNAMICYKNAEKIALKYQDEKIAVIYMYIGDLYSKQELWDLALKKYIESDLEWKKMLRSKEEILWELNLSMGIAYVNLGNRQVGLGYIKEGIKKVKDKGEGIYLANVYLMFANGYFLAKEHMEAINILNKAEIIYIEQNGYTCKELGRVYYNIGNNLRSIADFSKAKYYYLKSEEIFGNLTKK